MPKVLKTTLSILLFAFLCANQVLAGGIFSNSLLLKRPAPLSRNNGISSSDLFQKNLDAPNPVQWARKLPGTANANDFLHSSIWINTKKDFYKNFGYTNDVNKYLRFQEDLFKKAIKKNNLAFAESLDVKGNFVEAVMDDYFLSKGWEKFDGKRGRNGFDGLYVKRNNNGVIYEWLPVDAKAGSATLKTTNRGKQLTPEWNKGNLDDLLIIAEDENRINPSNSIYKRITDIKQMKRIPGDSPVVFTMKIKRINNQTAFVIEKLDITGNPIENPIYVTDGIMRDLCFEHLEEFIASYCPEKAKLITVKAKRMFKSGIIKNDSDLFRLLKREIYDTQAAKTLTKDLRTRNLSVDSRPKYTPAEKIQIAKNTQLKMQIGFSVASAALASGIIIVNDALHDNLSVNSLKNAGIIGVAVGGANYALDYSFSRLISSSKPIAKTILSFAGKKASAPAVAKLAAKIAPKAAKGLKYLGIGVAVAASSYDIGHSVYSYYTANSTQTDMMVHVGVDLVVLGGVVFFATEKGAEVGAAIGSLFGPAGTASGALIAGVASFVIAGIGAGVQMTYDYFAGKAREERQMFEIVERAKWKTRDNERKKQEELKRLDAEATRYREEAWKVLLKTY